jgi:hypothetical protein
LVSKPKVLRSNLGVHDLLKEIAADSYFTFVPTRAAREGEC